MEPARDASTGTCFAMTSPVSCGSGSGIFMLKRSLEAVMDMPRPLSSVVDALYDRPGVSGGKAARRVFGGTRGVKVKAGGVSLTMVLRKMFRGVVAAKFVILGGFADGLADGPWGRSWTFRWAI